MFNIGIAELIIIFIVALLVFGPKRLPELGRAVGKGLAELKRSLQDTKEQVEAELKETIDTPDIREAERSLQDVKEQVEAELKETIDASDIQPTSKRYK